MQRVLIAGTKDRSAGKSEPKQMCWGLIPAAYCSSSWIWVGNCTPACKQYGIVIVMIQVESGSRTGRHLLKGPHTYTWAQFCASGSEATDTYSQTMEFYLFIFRLEIRPGKGCECQTRAKRSVESVLSAAEGNEKQERRTGVDLLKWGKAAGHGGWCPPSSVNKPATSPVCMTDAATKQIPPGGFWKVLVREWSCGGHVSELCGRVWVWVLGWSVWKRPYIFINAAGLFCGC